MASKLTFNSAGQVSRPEIAKSQSMFHGATEIASGMRNQMQLGRDQAPGLWGYQANDRHHWVKPQVSYTKTGLQGEKGRWTEGGIPTAMSIDKQGLATMSTKDPEDHRWDKQYWYGKHYANMPKDPNAAGGVKHGEDLGKAMLSSDFFAYLERKKELEFEKEFEMFKLNQVDLSSPAERDWWQKMQPELYQKKMEFYRIQSQLEAVRAEINARGPSNNVDLYFMYLDGLGAFKTANLDTINLYLENRGNDFLWEKAMTNGKLLEPDAIFTYNTTKENINAVPI